MYKAILNVFPSFILPNLELTAFNVDFAKSIHSIIGSDGLIENPGSYRSSDAKPFGEDFM